MKTSTLAIGAAVLAVMTAGTALAQQAPNRSARGDADNDGRVSRAEFVDARVARLTAIDTNRDGTISAEERRAAFATQRSERASARFAALDKDGNGALSREEFSAPREARADRGERDGRHGMRGPRGGRGGDHAGHGGHRGGHRGGPGGGERGEARGPLAIADVQARLTARFDRIDANSDGYITADERSAARAAAREQRGERRAERMAQRAARQASPSASASE